MPVMAPFYGMLIQMSFREHGVPHFPGWKEDDGHCHIS